MHHKSSWRWVVGPCGATMPVDGLEVSRRAGPGEGALKARKAMQLMTDDPRARARGPGGIWPTARAIATPRRSICNWGCSCQRAGHLRGVALAARCPAPPWMPCWPPMPLPAARRRGGKAQSRFIAPTATYSRFAWQSSALVIRPSGATRVGGYDAGNSAHSSRSRCKSLCQPDTQRL